MAFFQIINRNPWGIISSVAGPNLLLKLGADGKLPAGVTLRADQTEQGLQGTSYDQYALYLQLYYQGTVSNVDVAGLNALTFDGFQDLNRIANAGGLDVLTASKLVQFHDNGTSKLGALSATGYYRNMAAAYADYQTFQLPSDANITAASVYFDPQGTGNHTFKVKITDNAGALLQEQTVIVNVSALTATEAVVTFSPAIKAKANTTYRLYPICTAYPAGGLPHWIVFNANQYAWGQASWNAAIDAVVTVSYQSFAFGTKDLIATNKTLAAASAEARLYLSTSTPAGSVTPYISFDGGATWGVMTEDVSYPRPDPKFAGYTERYFTADPPGGFNQMQLKLEAVNPDCYQTPQIKRYGLLAA